MSKSRDHKKNITSLPKAILNHIVMDFFDSKDSKNLSEVSKLFRENDKVIWYKRLQTDFECKKTFLNSITNPKKIYNRLMHLKLRLDQPDLYSKCIKEDKIYPPIFHEKFTETKVDQTKLEKYLKDATICGNETFIQSLLKCHPELKLKASLLHYAIPSGNFPLVKWLINDKKLVPDDDLLVDAYQSGNAKLVQWLREEKKLKLQASLSKKIVIAAAIGGDIDLMKKLVEEEKLPIRTTAVSSSLLLKKRFTFRDEYADSLLNHAARAGNLEIVKWLLDEKKLSPPDNLFEEAEKSGIKKLLKYLSEKNITKISKRIHR